MAERALGATSSPPQGARAAPLCRGQISEWGDTTGTPDEVGQPLGQAACAGLLDVEGSGEEIVEGAIAHGHHGAREADDVVGHAEVRRGQVHQQRLRVQAHKVAGAVRDRVPESQEGEVREAGLGCSPRQPTSLPLQAAPGPFPVGGVCKALSASKPF